MNRLFGLKALYKSAMSGLCRYWHSGDKSFVQVDEKPLLLGRKVFFQDVDEAKIIAMTPELFSERFKIHYAPRLLIENRWTKEKLAERCRDLALSGVIEEELFYNGLRWSMLIDEGIVARTYVGWAGTAKRWGLFAREMIEKDDFLGEYTGLVHLISYAFANVNPYCFHYPLPLSDTLWYVIDACHYGNEMSFANHNPNGNARADVLFWKGFFHVILFAERTIEKGEEITFDYGKTLFGTQRDL